MPSGSRVRANNVYGTVSDNPLLIGAVSFTSLGLSLLPAISGQHAVIVIDPKRVWGEPEIVVVTSHLAMGTTATITRGQYGTVARQHPQLTSWAHVPVGPDDYVAIVTSGTRPSDPYRGQQIFETDTDKFVSRSITDAWIESIPLGQWTSWSPTLTNITVGAGSSTFRYHKVGRKVDYKFRIVFGAGMAISDPPRISLPFTPAADYVAEYPISHYINLLDTGTRAFVGTAQIYNGTDLFLRFIDASGAAAAWTNVGTTVPFTWVSGDVIMGHGTYESTT